MACCCDHTSRFVCYGNTGGCGCPCDCHNHNTGKRKYISRKRLSPEEKKAIGTKIAAIRSNAGLSQKKLSHLLGYKTRSNLHQWEKGTVAPSPPNLKTLLDFFSVGIHSFLDDMSPDVRAKYEQII